MVRSKCYNADLNLLGVTEEAEETATTTTSTKALSSLSSCSSYGNLLALDFGFDEHVDHHPSQDVLAEDAVQISRLLGLASPSSKTCDVLRMQELHL
jgi:hypothetical protein